MRRGVRSNDHAIPNLAPPSGGTRGRSLSYANAHKRHLGDTPGSTAEPILEPALQSESTGVNDHPNRQRVFIENESTRVDGQSAAGALVFATEPGLLVDRARALASLSR